jgi:hypothetical protein
MNERRTIRVGTCDWRGAGYTSVAIITCQYVCSSWHLEMGTGIPRLRRACPPDGGWQWYQGDLGAFAHHPLDVVAVLFADVGGCRRGRLEDPSSRQSYRPWPRKAAAVAWVGMPVSGAWRAHWVCGLCWLISRKGRNLPMDPNRDTAYDAPTSASFAELDSRLGWTLGYPFALRALGIGSPNPPKTLLDYGCGPGRVANRIARSYDIRIIAVDPSAEMLAIASQRYRHPLITCRQVRNNRLDFLPDGGMDAAMSCFVFIVLSSREQLRAIAGEVWRVLRPGGRFVVLDPHPDSVGIRFSTGLLRGNQKWHTTTETRWLPDCR